jgi:hypothetical protein
VKAIINQDELRNVLESDELRCNIKDISILFDYLKEEYEEIGYKVDQSNSKQLKIYFRSGLGRITVSVEDLEENNILNIESSYNQTFVPSSLNNWMKKEFLGLRNSLWIILLLLTLVLVPFIVLSFFSSVSLRIPGFVLIGIGSATIVLYFILNMIVTRERKNRKNQAMQFIKGLKEKISIYSLEKPSSRICWNCFYEIKNNEDKCPKCKVELEQ